jgi:hypothetical protein
MNASGRLNRRGGGQGRPALLLFHASRSDCLLKNGDCNGLLCAALDTRVNLSYKK